MIKIIKNARYFKYLKYLLYIITIVLILISLYITYKDIKILKNNNKILNKKITTYVNVGQEYKQLKETIKTTYNVDSLQNLKKLLAEKDSYNKELAKQIVSLKKEREENNNKKEKLNTQYLTLKKKKDNEIRAKSNNAVSLEGSFRLDNIPTFNQYPSYPTGCESVALYLLLKYYKIDISVNSIIDNLRKGALPYSADGVIYGGNPEIEFVGNPLSYAGYGTYQNAIKNVANIYKAGITDGTGLSLNELLNIVSSGRPVLVWTSMNLALPYISTSWIYRETGETVYWKANEHAVLLVGFNDSNVIISDPIGGSIKVQNRNIFEARYNYYGKRNLYY